MENKFRNEMEIKLGDEKILLRPTFENCAALEAVAGSLAYLSWKFSKGFKRDMPGLTDFAQIIYHCQAAVDKDDSNKKKLSLETIWELLQVEGAAIYEPLMRFMVRIAAGSKDRPTISETQKKTLETLSPIEGTQSSG